MSRPRILIIKPVLPYPPDQGTKVVSFDLVRALEPDHDVTVLARVYSAAEAEGPARELETYCHRVVPVLPDNRRSLVHRIGYKLAYGFRALTTRRSIKSLYDCPGALVRAARRLAAEEFDLVIVEYWQLYPLFHLFPADRLVLLTHDIDLLVNRQNALLDRRLFSKLSKLRKWIVEQREEVLAYQRARTILALTERDAHAVRKLSRDRARVEVLPFGLDPARFASAPADPGERREVLFMGTMSAGFNRDALNFFIREVLPHLDDDVRVRIVGGRLPPELRFAEKDERIDVAGHVPDVAPYLARAACIVVPLRYGGGLRIRTLEAMMAGLPVVCTPVAIAGMDFTPGEHYLEGETGAELAARIASILGDPGLGERIAGAARKRVLERYGASRQAARTRALIQDIVPQ